MTYYKILQATLVLHSTTSTDTKSTACSLQCYCYMEKFDDSPVCLFNSSKILHECWGKIYFAHLYLQETGPPMSKYPKPSLCALRVGGGQDLPLVERSSRADEPANHSPVHRAGIVTASLQDSVSRGNLLSEHCLSLISFCNCMHLSEMCLPQ